MKKLTVKEIIDMESEDLEKIMTNEEFDRMQNLGMQYAWQLLDLLQDSAKTSGQNEDEEHVSISEYLDYLEEIKNK